MQGFDAIKLTPCSTETLRGKPVRHRELRGDGKSKAPRRMLKAVQQGRRRTLGAHGATNNRDHVCPHRRVSEAVGSPLRILAS